MMSKVSVSATNEVLKAKFGQVAKYRKSGLEIDRKRAKGFWKHFDVIKEANPRRAERLLYRFCNEYGIKDVYEDWVISNQVCTLLTDAPKEKSKNSIPKKVLSDCPFEMRNSKDKLAVSWKRARYIAFLIYGDYCACCGHPGTPESPLSVDHIKPRSMHPKLTTDIRNLQILCSDCNVGKDNWSEKDFRTEQKKIDAITVHHFPGSLTDFDKG